jgi:hypothetical protein
MEKCRVPKTKQFWFSGKGKPAELPEEWQRAVEDGQKVLEGVHAGRPKRQRIWRLLNTTSRTG